MYDVFSSFTGFRAKAFCVGGSRDADACKGCMCVSVRFVHFNEILSTFKKFLDSAIIH